MRPFTRYLLGTAALALAIPALSWAPSSAGISAEAAQAGQVDLGGLSAALANVGSAVAALQIPDTATTDDLRTRVAAAEAALADLRAKAGTGEASLAATAGAVSALRADLVSLTTRTAALEHGSAPAAEPPAPVTGPIASTPPVPAPDPVPSVDPATSTAGPPAVVPPAPTPAPANPPETQVASEAQAKPTGLGGGTANGTVTPPPPPTGQSDGTNWYIGEGCTTAFYIDKDCDGFGVGKKASGTYALGDSGGIDTTGDLPDADDMDPTVNTTASWQAKWGTDNAGMIAFLNQRKGFYRTQRIYYVSLTGDDATAQVNDPDHPYLTQAAAVAALVDREGGAIIFRGGEWTTGHFGFANNSVVTGSPGKPVLLMAYPGELVVSRNGNMISINPGVSSGYANGNVIVDGLNFRSTGIGLGDPISVSDGDNIEVRNTEFIGGHQLFFGNHNEDALIQDNVEHQMATHAIYFGWAAGPPPGQGTGDIDFDQSETDYGQLIADGNSPSFRGIFRGNVVYNSGSSGYEPIHFNTYTKDAIAEGNIISFGGGTAFGLQTGNYGTLLQNNVLFDNGRAGTTANIYQYNIPSSLCVIGATHRFVKYQNNTFWGGKASDVIRGTYPAGSVILSTPTNPPCPSQVVYTKDFTFSNNIFANSLGAGNAFNFGRKTFPETHIIDHNIVFNTTNIPKPSDVLYVLSNGASTVIPDGSYTLSQFAALAPNTTNMQYIDPKFSNASTSDTLAPGNFNLTPLVGSPAINAGTPTNAPKADVRGVLRSATPTIGAYEYTGSASPTPLAKLMAASRIIQEGDSVTLTWISLGAGACTGTGFSTGGAAAGTVTVTPSADTTYGLTCTAATGFAGATASPDLTVRLRPNSRLPTVTLTGPTHAASGAGASLAWSLNGSVAYGCAGGEFRPVGFGTTFFYTGPKSGTQSVFPTATKTYRLICFDRWGGTVVASHTVAVP